MDIMKLATSQFANYLTRWTCNVMRCSIYQSIHLTAINTHHEGGCISLYPICKRTFSNIIIILYTVLANRGTTHYLINC